MANGLLGAQALGRGQYGHTLKMYLILEIFFFTSTAEGDKLNAWL